MMTDGESVVSAHRGVELPELRRGPGVVLDEAPLHRLAEVFLWPVRETYSKTA